MKKIFFVVAAACGNLLLHAQQPADTSSLDEVVVTANKFPNKTSKTGKVITVITKEQLERSGGKDLSQVLAEQAGIFIAGANSNPGKDKSLYLRGARIDHTLITVDGIPLYDPSGIGGNFDLRNLNTALIERIEILKGSQSTLYGSDAIAGVINIITNKSSNKASEGLVTAGYGSYGTFRGGAAIQGKKEKTDYHASLAWHDVNGFNETENGRGFPVTDKDGYRQLGFQAGMGFRPAKQVLLQPYFRYSRIKGSIDQGAFTDELDYSYDQKSWQAGLRGEWTAGRSKITLLYTYNNTDRVYTDDSVKSRNGFDTWSNGSYKGAEHVADMFTTVSLNSQLLLTTGIDFRQASSDQQYQSISSYGTYKTRNSRDSLHQDQLGIYTAVNWQHPSGFQAEAGGRLNIHSAYGTYFVYNFNPSYLAGKQVKLFANISSAYRTPSLYQLFSEYGNRELQPEAAVTTEAGIQVFSKNNRWSGRAVAFQRRVNDVIYFYTNPVTYAAQYINQDRQKDRGWELEAGWQSRSGISLKTFYSYVTGKINTRIGGKDTTYNNLLRRPRSAAGISISVPVNKQLFFSSHFQYTGRRKDAYFDNTLFRTVYTTLHAYALWDLYAEYSLPETKLKLFAECRNITNSHYTEISGFRTMGINGSGGLRLRF